MSSPETALIPLKTLGHIPVLVEKMKFVDADFRGRPVADNLGGGIFPSFESAFEYASRDQRAEYNFRASLPFLMLAEITNPNAPAREQILRVKIERGEGFSPRSVEGHHGVSTNYADLFHIVIENVGSPDIFDRGLAWVDTEVQPPHFSFTLLGHNHGWVKDMDQSLEYMLLRTHKVLNDLTNGMPLSAGTEMRLLK